MNDNPATPSNPDQLTPAEQADHDRSVNDYPDIHFSPTEYVVIDVERSFWGIVKIWLFALLAFFVLGFVCVLIDQTSPISLGDPAMMAILSATIILPLLIGWIGTSVYNQNRFVVTNERIIANIQYTPFAHRNQNIEIEHVEDCSYSQGNPLQILFDYGSIRLSTVGNEQTYLYTYVARPKEQFRIVNNVVQQVDEGRSTRYDPNSNTSTKK